MQYVESKALLSFSYMDIKKENPNQKRVSSGVK